MISMTFDVMFDTSTIKYVALWSKHLRIVLRSVRKSSAFFGNQRKFSVFSDWIRGRASFNANTVSCKSWLTIVKFSFPLIQSESTRRLFLRELRRPLTFSFAACFVWLSIQSTVSKFSMNASRMFCTIWLACNCKTKLIQSRPVLLFS